MEPKGWWYRWSSKRGVRISDAEVQEIINNYEKSRGKN